LAEAATLKLIIFGDAGTGKTTLAHRYMTGLYIQDKVTLGVQFHVKKVELALDDDRQVSVKIQIWDFGGEKRFRFLLPSYCRGAHGGLFLYDITNKASLDSVSEWTSLVFENAGQIPVMLVGAKADLEDERQVSSDEGMEIAKQQDLAGFAETSSKTGLNVESVFETLTRVMFSRLLNQ